MPLIRRRLPAVLLVFLAGPALGLAVAADDAPLKVATQPSAPAGRGDAEKRRDPREDARGEKGDAVEHELRQAIGGSEREKGDAGLLRPPSPEEIDPIMQILRDVRPEIYDRVAGFLKDNPERARRLLSTPWLIRLRDLKQRDQESYALRVQDLRLERVTNEIGQQMREAYRKGDQKVIAELSERLRAKVGEHFDVRQKFREREVQLLQNNLQEVRRKLQLHKEGRDKLIQERIANMARVEPPRSGPANKQVQASPATPRDRIETQPAEDIVGRRPPREAWRDGKPGPGLEERELERAMHEAERGPDRNAARPMSPRELEEVLEVVHEYKPELFAQVSTFLKDKPEQARAALQSVPWLMRMVERKRRDPDGYKLSLDDVRLDREVMDLGRQLRSAVRSNDQPAAAALRQTLQAKLVQQADVRLKLREREVEMLERQLQVLREDAQRRLQARDKLIQSQIDQILPESRTLRKEPTF